MNKVTNHTRAGRDGKTIYCPNCNEAHHMGHFSWSAFVCVNCKAEVEKTEFMLEVA